MSTCAPPLGARSPSLASREDGPRSTATPRAGHHSAARASTSSTFATTATPEPQVESARRGSVAEVAPSPLRSRSDGRRPRRSRVTSSSCSRHGGEGSRASTRTQTTGARWGTTPTTG
jgi:hypothetical protein